MEPMMSRTEIQSAADALVSVRVPWEEAVKLMKHAVLERALEVSRGNKCRAARLLKMHRNTFERALKATA
jgi:DNA-binding NtrC family response regulator